MPCEFDIFDPQACAFPPARVAHLPKGLGGISVGRSAPWPGGMGRLPVRHFARGRYALREAYRLAGVGAGGALLAPAYHCRTMLDPAVALGAEIYLYPIQADFSPDLKALQAMVECSAVPVRAVLATHFFGFPQAFGELRDWCSARSIALVEDCSHALFSERFQAPGVGLAGDFVVASPYKFFAAADGGLLYVAEGARMVMPTRPAGWLAELKGVADTLRQAWGRRRARDWPQAGALREWRWTPGEGRRETVSSPSRHYLAADEYRASLRWSRWLTDRTDVARLAERRRAHYRQWLQATAGLPNCRPVLPEPGERCIPYMFPLYIDRPDFHFYALKHLGVPIWRWDEMAVSDCPVAADYRLKLLHLPCHQELMPDEMAWMTETVREVLSMPAPGNCLCGIDSGPKRSTGKSSVPAR